MEVCRAHPPETYRREAFELISTVIDMIATLVGMSVELTADPAAANCCPSPAPPEIDFEQSSRVASLARALADPVRVQILDALRARPGELCQCELAPLLPISQPTLSHHLRKLQETGLVEVERRGRWAYYSLAPGSLEGLRAWLS